MNEDGGLDLSRIQMEGNELFSCTGVDEVGNSARTRFRITSSLQEGLVFSQIFLKLISNSPLSLSLVLSVQ